MPFIIGGECWGKICQTVIPAMFPVRLTRKIRLPIRQRIRFHATDLAGHPSGGRPIRCGSRNFDRKFPTLHWEQPCWHPVRTARHPRVHHDPLWPKHNIPTAYLPNPSLETPPSRVAPVSSPLSAPSHSRSFGRPPFSLCPGFGSEDS